VIRALRSTGFDLSKWFGSNVPVDQSPLRTARLAFFDLETTGLRPDRGARITEMAVVDQEGIRFDWASDEEPPSDAAMARQVPLLIDALRGSIVVGHNLSFDFRFLTYEAERLGHEGLDVRFADTLGLARSLWPYRDTYQLGALLAAAGCGPDEELHTAIGDALATRALFWTLVDEGEWATLADVSVQRLRWSGGGPPQPRRFTSLSFLRLPGYVW
jgi:DNA polymerase III epsilon subunit-like protein